ncbi:alpha/beta fold hydrolase [Salinisphaera hydrothermalis]|uniref:Poly(3-hydroxyalkanoate) depolymerase n=1 Tax=Salinisphaera hydrothermalis (strain C41B8) TaxID=1304275 RepID=A0A084IR15_SALHC|nr:alpha/beta fold hydrolase [Salinisphaera hydrothermalis]KEZ79149.1 poly(3-hydroxyalkanoate) depolymerase [Salinisphaera hydrothermalis C41B8]
MSDSVSNKIQSLTAIRRPGRRMPPELSVLRRRTRIQVDWIDVDGVRLRYGIRRGRGRPMLILNTIGANLDMLLPLVNALDDAEIIVPEMPGAGRSPPRSMPHRLSWYAALIATFLERLGYDELLDLVGLSWGGSLAQQFALDYPAQVNRLVLASSSIGWPSLATHSSTLKRLAAARRHERSGTLPATVAGLYGGLMRRRPELITRRGRYASGPSTRGYVNQLIASLGWTSAHRLHRLHCPTLIMGGDDDPIVPLINSRILYWLIPKSYLHIVRGGGHLFLLMRANESAGVIRRFLNERRYDGTDGADYYAARGLGPDGALVPRLPGRTSEASKPAT